MTTYADAILVDLAALALSCGLLARYGRLGHAHPATIYLFFHLYSFSWRLWSLANGAVPLFGEPFWGPAVEPLAEEEIVRASLTADGVLVVMVLAWLAAARRARVLQLAPPHWLCTPLNASIVKAVAWATLPAGIVGVLLFARLPGIDNEANVSALGEWRRSSYVLMLQSWAGLALIAVVYLRGFRWWLVVLIGLYLGVMAYQGFHRYRAIIPSILLVQIYLERRGERWPNLRTGAVLLGLALVFFPLKNLGRAMQERASPAELAQVASASLVEVASGEHGDQLFLDELASGLSLVDRAGIHFWGAPYLAVLTLPVPREIWPDKPAVNDSWKRVDRPSRPMLESGMILTFIGDLYANFGYPGLLIIAPLVAYWLGRGYFAASAAGYWAVGHFAYLLLACNLLQVYRDGLVSIFVFTVVNMLPLTLIVALHAGWSRRPGTAPAGRP